MATDKFETAYDAGYDAGRYGANNFNSHYSFFRTEELMKEWQRGNDVGSAKRQAEEDYEREYRLKNLKNKV